LWDDDYARSFHEGDICQAWDRSPRIKGAKRVAMISLTTNPKKQHISKMPDEDYEKEGFAYLAEKHLTIFGDSPDKAFQSWRDKGDKEYWVIDFKLEDEG